MDRRVLFFLIAAGACAALIAVTPSELRRVPEVVSVVYLVLALLTALEQWSERRRHREPKGERPTSNP